MLKTLPTIEGYMKSEPRAWVNISLNPMPGQSYITIRRFDGQLESTIEIPIRHEGTAAWLAAHIYNSYKNYSTLRTVEELLKPAPEQTTPDDTKPQPGQIGIDMHLTGTKHDVLNDFAALGMYLRQQELTAGKVEGLKTGTADLRITQ